MHLPNEKTHSVLLNEMKNTQNGQREGMKEAFSVSYPLSCIYKLQSVCTLLHVRGCVCVWQCGCGQVGTGIR